jgi:hypothetical protein
MPKNTPPTTPARIASNDRPRKPKDFPLFPHASKQWAKKIKGQTRYFGPWSDPKAALKRYLAEKDYHQAGVKPPTTDGFTVRDLVNSFLTSKQRLVDSGELSQRTFDDYDDSCRRVLEVFGKLRQVETLRPTDFEKLRANFAKTHGPVRLCKDITCVRGLFKYGADSDLIAPVKFGPGFKRPSRLVLRKLRQSRGPRMFSADEIRAMLKAAGPQLHAMILLGINCGLGNNDCALLTTDRINGAWIDYPRPKTGIHRRCPLWPETVKALKAAMAARPEPKEEAHQDTVFITKQGNTWEPKSVRDNPISKEVAKLLAELGIQRRGVNFYALRHTFQTIGEKARDKDAVRSIMGHAESANDMSAVYSEEAVADERLRTVADHVRTWLFSKTR